MKRILSFHIISQIGYMLMGLGLFTVAGVAGAVLFLVHQIPIKTVLFLVSGLVEDETGSSRLGVTRGLAVTRPLIAVLFALPALSLAGLPPFSGFVAKLALIDAGIEAAETAIVVVALVGSALTLLSMLKIWLGVFWGAPPEAADGTAPTQGRRTRTLLVGSTSLGVAGTLTVALFAGPLWDMSLRAGAELLDPPQYIEVVFDQPTGTAAGGS